MISSETFWWIKKLLFMVTKRNYGATYPFGVEIILSLPVILKYILMLENRGRAMLGAAFITGPSCSRLLQEAKFVNERIIKIVLNIRGKRYKGLAGICPTTRP